jgi:hypothetical protein
MRLVRRADNLIFMRRLSLNLGGSTSLNPKTCPGVYRDCFTFALNLEKLGAVLRIGLSGSEQGPLSEPLGSVNRRRFF